MYTIPVVVEDNLKKFATDIGCKWLGAVLVEAKPLCKELNCHNNVLNYINNYGGKQKIGYYFVKNLSTQKFEAILHSIVEKSNRLIDITPFNDDREYNIVGLVDSTDISLLSPHILE